MKRLLWWLGALNLLVLLAHAALSYVEAGAATYAERPHGQIVFYGALGERVAGLASRMAPRAMTATQPANVAPRRAGKADYPPADDADRLRQSQRKLSYAIGGDWVLDYWFIDFYALPLLLSTILASGALLVICRSGPGQLASTPRTVKRWGIAYAVVMGTAMPVLVPDFWLSFAWGRTMWWGGNPYYDVPAAAVEGLPFDAPILKMTYGPLWALVSWGVTALTRGSVFWGVVAFKTLLVGSWIALLHLVHRLTNERPVREQATALVVAGWLPLGAVQIAGDGHNDAIMLLGVLLWLFQLERGNPRIATLALALSVGVKYVTAPLFLLDFLHSTAGTPALLRRVRAYLPQAAIALGVWVVAFAPFLHSLAFFGETTAVREGYFFLPADAVKGIGTLLGANLRPVAIAVMGVFPLATLLCVWRYWRAPSNETLRHATAGIMLSVLFIAAGHVWPWYVLWLSVPAALLVPTSLLSRWSVGVLIGAPFPLLYWTAYPRSDEFRRFQLPSLVVYAFALAWMFFGWRLVVARRDGGPTPRSGATA